jgi:putative MATE family efflux protein
LGVIGVVMAPIFLSWIGASAAVVAQGANFTRIMLGGSGTVVFLFLLNAIFRGAGDAAIAMRVLWIANIINIIVCPIFIFWLDFGVTGAAIGTTIGRGVGVAYAAYHLFYGEKRFEIHARHWRLDHARMWRLITVSAPGALQYLIQTASWMGLVRVVSGFGSEAVAGYSIAIRVVIFALLPSVGLANAAATLVGQNLGAEKPERSEQAVWKAAFYNASVQTLIGILLVLFAGQIAGVFTNEPQVLAIATDALRIIAYGFFFYAIGMVVESAFNGAGDTWTPTYLNLFVFWLFEIPLAYVLAYHFGMKEHGAFWAITAAFSCLTLVSVPIFRMGRWKLKKV